jgi:hypothetical protein
MSSSQLASTKNEFNLEKSMWLLLKDQNEILKVAGYSNNNPYYDDLSVDAYKVLASSPQFIYKTLNKNTSYDNLFDNRDQLFANLKCTRWHNITDENEICNRFKEFGPIPPLKFK